MASFEVPAIQLDAQESAILDLIHRFTLHLGNARPDLPAVECRVAGGWVRDKVRRKGATQSGTGLTGHGC